METYIIFKEDNYMIMRKIIDWCYEHDNVGPFVERFCDGALLCYVPLVISCFIYQRMLNKK